MKYHIEIISGVKKICIETSKGLVTNEEISLVPNKYKSLLNKMDEAYHCIRTINVDNNLIEKNSY